MLKGSKSINKNPYYFDKDKACLVSSITQNKTHNLKHKRQGMPCLYDDICNYKTDNFTKFNPITCRAGNASPITL